jgi:hypothetical protein
VATYLLLFERERFDNTAEQSLNDLNFDYAGRWAFDLVGRHQIDADVFRKPCEEDEITERDIIACTVAFDGTAEQLVHKIDHDCHEVSAGGFFSVIGEISGSVKPVAVNYAQVLDEQEAA